MNEQPTVNELAEMDARNSAIIQQLQVYLSQFSSFYIFSIFFKIHLQIPF